MDLVKPCLLLLLFLLIVEVSQEKDAIPWQPDRKLSWADFKGTPPGGKRVAATTASGISYSYTTIGSNGRYKLDYKVTTLFYPHQSWYHSELCDSVVLSHEQLHFDISELYARKMRFRLERTSFSENVKQEIRDIYQETLKELADFQDQYDWETNFSRNREAQLEWNARIAEALKSTGKSNTP